MLAANTMSRSKHRNMQPEIALFCRNPYCSQGQVQKAFAAEAAFQKHLAMLPQCTTYFLQQHSQRSLLPRSSGIVSHILPATRNITTLANVGTTSNKRKCLLRRNVVNVIPMECYNVVIPEPVVPVAASEFAMQTRTTMQLMTMHLMTMPTVGRILVYLYKRHWCH